MDPFTPKDRPSCLPPFVSTATAFEERRCAFVHAVTSPSWDAFLVTRPSMLVVQPAMLVVSIT